jgi:hypothetical protein
MILAVIAFVLGGAWAWHGLPPFERDATDVCPGYRLDEGTRYETHHGWPPGAIRCTYTTVAGDERQARFVPWREYLVLALWAGAVGLGTSGFIGSRTCRAARILGACGLFLCGWIVVFV